MKRISLLIILFATSCTRVCHEYGETASGLIERRIGRDVQWECPCDEHPCIDSYVQELLEKPLSAESAIQIALLNNPQVQAFFEEIGIAHADLVEAGLFTNPVFEIESRFPLHQRLKTNIEYLITGAFLDLFLIPLRIKVASVELKKAELEAANQILNLAFDVRSTYYELLSEEHRYILAHETEELADMASEIAFKQRSIANINPLENEMVQANLFEARIEVDQAMAKIIPLREKLKRLLGLSQDMCLNLCGQELDTRWIGSYCLCCLENVALESRLDLQAARFDLLRHARTLGLKQWWTYTDLQAGLAGERDTDGVNTLGFGLAGQIPIFNYGQAARMRIFAEMRQRHREIEAMEISILSEVREAYKAIENQVRMIQQAYQHLLPAQQKILQLSEGLYNVMDLGVFRMIDAKRHELAIRRQYLDMLKDYSVAQVQLDRALGGNLHRLISQEGVEQ
jgi:cobalt-zinc-cadmium efflux system outer membrane protein